MLQSSGRGGLPLSAAPPPPAGRARPDPTVFSGHSATGSSKAEAVEGKGDRRAKRQKEEARLVACGGGWQGQPLSGPRAPPTRAPACQEPAFLSVGPAVATRRMPCPPGGSRGDLGWGSSPHRPPGLLGPGLLCSGVWGVVRAPCCGWKYNSCQAQVRGVGGCMGKILGLGLPWGPPGPGIYMGLPGRKWLGALARALAFLGGPWGA